MNLCCQFVPLEEEVPSEGERELRRRVTKKGRREQLAKTRVEAWRLISTSWQLSPEPQRQVVGAVWLAALVEERLKKLGSQARLRRRYQYCLLLCLGTQVYSSLLVALDPRHCQTHHSFH